MSTLSASLRFLPRPAQIVILRRLALYRFVVAVCHRRLGKTLLGVNWLCREGLSSTRNDYRGYYFCATQKQAKIVSWQYFKNTLDSLYRLGIVGFNETELRVDLPNNGKIYLGSAESIENYRGIYIDRIVMDEVASWLNGKYAYEEVLRPAMSDRIAHALIIGTVKGLDQFYNFYRFGLSDIADLEDWGTVDLKASMTGILPDKELRMLRATMSNGAYSREMENDFFAEVEDVLITAIEVMDAMKREAHQTLVALAPVTMGIDVGLTGDPSVVAIRQGRHVRPLIELDSVDPMATASKISNIIKRTRPAPTVIYGDAGQGLAVLSRLRDLGHHNVVDIFFNGEAGLDNCFNRRAAMAYRVKEALPDLDLPMDEILLQEMVNQYLEDDPNHKIKLVKKRKIKEIIGHSPNRMDALMLTYAEEDEPLDDFVSDLANLNMTPEQLIAYRSAIDRLKKSNNGGQLVAEDYDVLNYMNSENGYW